jgi:hypothetical protein
MYNCWMLNLLVQHVTSKLEKVKIRRLYCKYLQALTLYTADCFLRSLQQLMQSGCCIHPYATMAWVGTILPILLNFNSVNVSPCKAGYKYIAMKWLSTQSRQVGDGLLCSVCLGRFRILASPSQQEKKKSSV